MGKEMKLLLSLLSSLLLSGCLLILDNDCDTDDPDYSHTEYDCYHATRAVEVCDGRYCWEEWRESRVCDEHHICFQR